MRRLRTLAVPAALALTLGACADSMPTSSIDPQFARSATASLQADAATYEVTITNLTSGQPFTPPLTAVHRRPESFFRLGEPASHGIQQIAENGNLAPMLEALEQSRHVIDFTVTEGPTAPPLLPGESVTFTIGTQRGGHYISFASMLICTNDGFTGVSGADLPRAVGQVASWDVGSYDAGTEVNTEDFVDLVPPCPPLTGVDTDDTGTGMTNPALAEGGVIRMHPGVVGGADLDPAIHGWDDPVARIVVKRIG